VRAKSLKKSKRKCLVGRLDNVFSRFIRQRDERCVTCGSRDNLQCGHLFSRQSYSTRWDPDNAFAQCSSCNLKHEYDSYPLTNWFLGMFGKTAYDRLHAKYKSLRKFSNTELEEMIREYQEKLNG